MDDELILIYEAGETRLIPKSEIYIPSFERDDETCAAIAAETEMKLLGNAPENGQNNG